MPNGRYSVVPLRRANAGDAQAIAELHVAAWRAAYRGLLPDDLLDRLSVDERKRSWAELLSDNGSSFTLVATDDEGRVEGFCMAATPSRDADANDATAEIAATYVVPERWRAGVGRVLLWAALAQLRADGYREATLWVFSENEQALSFYRRFGFEPAARKPGTIGAVTSSRSACVLGSKPDLDALTACSGTSARTRRHHRRIAFRCAPRGSGRRGAPSLRWS